MAGQAGILELSAGSALRLDGTEWTGTAIEAQHGRGLLKAGGDGQWRGIRWAVHPPGCPARAGGGPPSISEEIREAIFAVRKETRNRSRTSMTDKYVLVAQYAAEHFGPQVRVPCYWTLREVWLEWFGPGGTRPRYDRSADGIEASKVHVVVHRPGEVVALDTTPLPV